MVQGPGVQKTFRLSSRTPEQFNVMPRTKIQIKMNKQQFYIKAMAFSLKISQKATIMSLKTLFLLLIINSKISNVSFKTINKNT